MVYQLSLFLSRTFQPSSVNKYKLLLQKLNDSIFYLTRGWI